MDWNTIHEELRRLTTLVDGWSQSHEIPAVERDLALEKLRSLYEAVRFAEPGRAEMPAETDPEAELLSESIDLGEVLSLDGFPDLDEPAGPVFVDPTAAPAAPVAPVAEPAVAETMPAGESAEPDPAIPAPVEPAAAEPIAVSTVEPETVPAEPAAEPESAPAEPTAEPMADAPAPAEPTIAPESVPTEPEEPAAASEPEAEIPAPTESGPKTASPAAETPAAETPAATPTVENAPTERAHPHGAPTLFGLEDEEIVRHRHKQRVIMSLYDPNPEVETIPVRQSSATSASPASSAPSPTSAARTPGTIPDEHPEAVFEEINIETSADPDSGIDRAESSAEAASDPIADPVAESATEHPAPESAEPVTGGWTAPYAAVEPAPAPATPATPEETSARTDEARTDEARMPKNRPESDLANVPGGAVLGEVINHDVQTLADTIAPPRDVASELLRNEPVTDLRKAIGLNDKFLLIRDLFDGDGEAYERAIGTLNDCGDLDDCMIYIAEHYAWNPNSDGAKLLMDLLERKFA